MNAKNVFKISIVWDTFLEDQKQPTTPEFENFKCQIQNEILYSKIAVVEGWRRICDNSSLMMCQN